MRQKHLIIYGGALCALGLLVAISPSRGLIQVFGMLYLAGWAAFALVASRGNTGSRK